MPETPTRYHDLVAAVMLYFFCLASAGLLWRSPLLLTALLVVVAGITLMIWREPVDRIFYFVPLVLGPTGEAFAVYFGAWQYTDTELLPLWLPFLWGIAGLCMGRVMTLLQRRFQETREPRPDPPHPDPIERPGLTARPAQR